MAPATRPSGLITAQPSPQPSFEPSGPPSDTPSPEPVQKVSPEEGKRLRAEMVKAQSTELKALRHQSKLELRDLKAAQDARMTEWRRDEKAKRRQFFEQNKNGPQRRAYVQDFMARRKALTREMTQARHERAREQEARVTALKQEQTEKLREFDSFLERGERPPMALWPQQGR